jgi:integrase
MKGTVTRRWKVTEQGDPKDCKHKDDTTTLWTDERKDEQRCPRCGARRIRAVSWTWQHEAMRNGARVFITGTENKKTDAQKALTDSLAKHATGQQIDPNKETVATFLRGWLDVKKLKVKPGTWRSYHDTVEFRLIPTLGDTKLSELAHPAIARTITELRKSGRRDGTGGLSETSLHHTVRTLNTALEAAVKSRKIARNPIDDLDQDAKPTRDHTEMRTWTAEQLHAFLRSTEEHRLHMLFLTAATTAMRRGELLGLKWSDVKLNGKIGQLAVRRSRTSVGYEVHEGTPKNDKARTIALDALTVAALGDWRQRQRQERMAWGEGRVVNDYVFTREDGSPLHPHQVADSFDTAVLRSGQPVLNFHGLRHTWATISLEAGVNVKVVQERLGHFSPAFTLTVYAHSTPGMQAEAADTFAGLVLGS